MIDAISLQLYFNEKCASTRFKTRNAVIKNLFLLLLENNKFN